MLVRRTQQQYEQLSEFERGLIIGLTETGWLNRRIGRHLGRSDIIVARYCQQWITEGRVHRRRGLGRHRNTNEHEDRAIRAATERPPPHQQRRYRRFDAIYHLQSTLWYRGKQFIDDWLTLVSEADVH